MCNTFAVYFQIFATFGYKKVKNSDFLKVAKRIIVICGHSMLLTMRVLPLNMMKMY